jgi:type I restriction enzyme S subunit
MQKVKQKTESWIKKPLGGLLDNNPQYGYTASGNSEAVGPKMFRITDIKKEGIDWSNMPYCKIKESEKSKYLIQKGDIVFARTGSTGLSYFFRENPPEPTVFASYLIRIKPNSNKCLPSFLSYFFQSEDYWSQVIGNSSGSVQRGLNASKLKQLEVTLPPIDQQQKIVKVLDAAQEAVEVQDKLIKETQELKWAMMHKLFTEGTRGEKQKKTKIGKILESWELINIKDLGQVITGSTPSTKKPEYYGEKYKLISPADLDNGIYIKTAHKTLTEEGIKTSRQLPKNTVLVGCIGNVGKLGMTIDEISATNQQINAVISNKFNDPHFLLYLFLFYKGVFVQNARQTTVPILSKSSFEKIELPRPKKEEQKEIANILQKIDEKIEIHKKKKQKHEELFQSLLHKLMSHKEI